MPSAIVGSVLMLSVVGGMAAIATPAFIDFAQSQRDLLAAQAALNRDTLACVDGPGTCTRLQPGEEMVCVTETNPVDGAETTRCRVESLPAPGPPVVGPP